MSNLVTTLATAIATAITTAAETATTTTAAAAAEATTATAATAATAAATEATAAGTLFLRTCFVDRQLTTVEFRAVNFLGCFLRFFCSSHGHEGETTRATGHPVHSDVNVGHTAILAEVRTEFVFSRLE